MSTIHHPKAAEDWDTIISPKTSLLQLNLGELWRYRDLIRLLVRRDFIAKYKQTILGPLWHFLQPVFTTLVSVLVFNTLANLSTNGKPALLFQLCGIIIWNYFASCLTNTANTFKDNAAIFGKVYFPRLAIPVSVIISNLVQLGIQCILLLAALCFFGVFKGFVIAVNSSWLLLPAVVIIMAGIGLGLGIIISSLTTKYRDFQVLVAFGVQLLMFGSAVNYPLSVLQTSSHANNLLLALVKWNPISSLVETFRNILLGGDIAYGMLLYTLLCMFITLFTGALLFNKVEKTFMDTV